MSPTWVRRIALINIIANVAIVITGGAVRLTGSGLGCPSWPNCSPDSFHTTAALGINGAIEWGNRLFGVVVGFIAVVGLFAAWRRRPRRTSLVKMAALLLVAILAQGGIGAMTVITGLNPWSVSLHFLVSVGALAVAVAFWVRSGEPDGPVRVIVPRPVRLLAWAIIAAALATVAIGTMVTGSGPHAGDPETPRLDLDGHLITQLHADAAFLLIGLTAAMLLTLKAVKAPPVTMRAAWWLAGVLLAQGAIGYVQYFTNLPAILVGAHMLGASVLWIAALLVLYRTRVRDLADDPQAKVPDPRPATTPAELAVG
ncbi:COX15/CtaA family protein [Phytomonospora sp. NPDC050363]|uniref:COX15/CtaA family protein n=1 Tax=Phytomonospora sp. NPDC050363 TaxID=3155642 RepID=UPI0033C11165